MREMFQVDLVYDPNPRRNDPESLKCLLAPFEKFVALAIAFEFVIQIQGQGVWNTEKVYLHRVVYH
jgi:hypothetical protein